MLIYSYDFGHTGIIESAAIGKITAIEGNTTAGNSGSQSNGGGVYRRTRSTSCVRAYIRPIKAMQTTETEDDGMLTYEQWKEYQARYRKELQDNDSGTWSAEAPGHMTVYSVFFSSRTSTLSTYPPVVKVNLQIFLQL